MQGPCGDRLASIALRAMIVAGRDAYFLEAFAHDGLFPTGHMLLTRAVAAGRDGNDAAAEKIPAPTAFTVDWSRDGRE